MNIKYNVIDVIKNKDNDYLRDVVNKKLYKVIKFIHLYGDKE